MHHGEDEKSNTVDTLKRSQHTRGLAALQGLPHWYLTVSLHLVAREGSSKEQRSVLQNRLCLCRDKERQKHT